MEGIIVLVLAIFALVAKGKSQGFATAAMHKSVPCKDVLDFMCRRRYGSGRAERHSYLATTSTKHKVQCEESKVWLGCFKSNRFWFGCSRTNDYFMSSEIEQVSKGYDDPCGATKYMAYIEEMHPVYRHSLRFRDDLGTSELSRNQLSYMEGIIRKLRKTPGVQLIELPKDQDIHKNRIVHYGENKTLTLTDDGIQAIVISRRHARQKFESDLEHPAKTQSTKTPKKQ